MYTYIYIYIQLYTYTCTDIILACSSDVAGWTVDYRKTCFASALGLSQVARNIASQCLRTNLWLLDPINGIKMYESFIYEGEPFQPGEPWIFPGEAFGQLKAPMVLSFSALLSGCNFKPFHLVSKISEERVSKITALPKKSTLHNIYLRFIYVYRIW